MRIGNGKTQPAHLPEWASPLDSFQTSTKRERTMEGKTQTISNLKTKLAAAWLRGKEQRVEIGKLLLELREHAKHGDWGKWMAELNIPCSTANDYMLEAQREIHGIRKFKDGQAAIDSEEQHMQRLVGEHAALVESSRAAESRTEPQHPPVLEDRTKVSGPTLHCTAAQREAYINAKHEDKDRVYYIFHKALLEVIGEIEPSPLDSVEAEQGVADAPLAA
jgi:hypothetical protein